MIWPTHKFNTRLALCINNMHLTLNDMNAGAVSHDLVLKPSYFKVFQKLSDIFFYFTL